jgi:DNA repair protein RecO (recombination protein O)
MEFSEKALVLKVGRFREIDVWTRLFSPKRGVFTAVAFGGSVSRRRFCGCLDVFNHVDFKVKSCRRGQYLHLLEGRLVEAHPKLRSDPERLGPAVNCMKFFEAAYHGAQDAREAYGLLLAALRALAGETSPNRLFPLFFRASVAMSQGFFPDFAACSTCGASLSLGQGAFFHVEEGRFFCQKCPPLRNDAAIRLGPETHSLLALAKSSPPDAWVRAAHSAWSGREFARIVDRFVGRHMGISWENGRFVRT